MEEINPQAVSHISEAARNLQKIEEYLQEQADMLYKEYVKEEDGYIISKGLFQEKEIMQSYVVMNVLEQAAGKEEILLLHILRQS